MITVCYNSEQTIENTIKSVLGQNYNNLEYIIVDGESKDNTLSIIKSYANINPCIKVISESDEGISDAFNKRIKMSSRTLIDLINPDDKLSEGAIELVNKVYLKIGADIIYGDTIVIVDEENSLKKLVRLKI